MKKAIVIVGEKYGRLTVLSETESAYPPREGCYTELKYPNS